MAQSRQLGPSEENWTKCTAGGTGIAIFAIAIKQQIGLHSIVLAAKSVCDRHAVLRSRILLRKKDKPSLEIIQASAPSIESISWPEIDSNDSQPSRGLLILHDDDEQQSMSRALHRIVTSELNLGFNPIDEAVDVFQVHVYSDPYKASTVLVLRVHCGACDRHSTIVVARQFLSYLDAAVAGSTADVVSCPAAADAVGLLPAMEDLAPKSSKGFFKKGLDAVGYAMNSSKCSLLPFQPGFGKNSGAFRTEILVYKLDKPETEDLIAACKRESTIIAAALSAAFLKAAANVNELKQKKQDTFSFTNVLNCRPYFDPPLDENVVGNYSAGLPQDEQVKDSLSFWDLARHISAATEKSLAKAHQFSELSVLNMLLSQVLKHPSITPQSSLRTALFTLFVDGPADCKWTGLNNNLKVAGTIGPVASMHMVGPCFALAEALLDGPELCLTFVYVTPLYIRTQMDEFLWGALELLKSSTK